MSKRPRVGWHTITDAMHSGYGYVGNTLRDLVRRNSIDVLVPDEFDWDAFVCVSPPRAAMVGPAPRPDLIFHTMFEAYPAPPRWVDVLNRAGLVWVPCRYSADVFQEGGLTTPVVVSGYGYDPEVYYPIQRTGRDGPFRVRIWGDHMLSRKNIMRAVQAYTWADLPDATLEIKINDTMFARGPMTVTDTDGLARDDISIIAVPLRREELLTWLHEGDVILLLTGGEGYSLIHLEAMATGIPLISMLHTGMLEFIQPQVIYQVPSLGRGPAPSMIASYGIPGLTIEQPDVDATVDLLRHVYANREEAYARGMAGYESIRHLTWARAGAAAADLIAMFAASNTSLLD
jgi:glycosyltransferase involved in cell wall biosynthesis